jgi:hypothetical protein
VTRLDRFAIGLDLPAGWEGEIYRRPPAAEGLRPQGIHEPPVAHAATFPLPAERGDFGNGAVDQMGPDDIFVSVFEYDAASAGTALFASAGIPRLDDGDFSPSTLQRGIPGHSGCQRFFHVGDRAFCLYVVLGSHRFRTRLVRRVNAVLDGLDLG